MHDHLKFTKYQGMNKNTGTFNIILFLCQVRLSLDDNNIQFNV